MGSLAFPTPRFQTSALPSLWENAFPLVSFVLFLAPCTQDLSSRIWDRPRPMAVKAESYLLDRQGIPIHSHCFSATIETNVGCNGKSYPEAETPPTLLTSLFGKAQDRFIYRNRTEVELTSMHSVCPHHCKFQRRPTTQACLPQRMRAETEDQRCASRVSSNLQRSCEQEMEAQHSAQEESLRFGFEFQLPFSDHET